ncbi:unnamed protein product [Haemonchus placei]|uniref:Uncharacterized protein n=1 Tax=Haemonchus placei TaxID=6290 RepID=A0A0N4X801_HAEPC|nr:unnamed protein product [Haemonchus placei]
MECWQEGGTFCSVSAVAPDGVRKCLRVPDPLLTFSGPTIREQSPAYSIRSNPPPPSSVRRPATILTTLNNPREEVRTSGAMEGGKLNRLVSMKGH